MDARKQLSLLESLSGLDTFERKLRDSSQFPLRSKELAAKSQIKTRPTLLTDLQKIFFTFSQSSDEPMLFLRHVNKVDTFYI